MAKLFVYGTLRKDKEPTGKPPFVLIGYKMFAYSGNFEFPYIQRTRNPEDKVLGELLTVSESKLKELDRYEGVDRGMYSRDLVTVHTTSETPASIDNVHVYVEKGFAPKPVLSGNWFRR